MASVIYNNALLAEASGLLDYENDTFKLMLVDDTYVADRDAHIDRADVTGEAVGTGYTAGGAAVVATVTKDDANDRVDITFDDVLFDTVTLADIRGAIIYKSTGVAANDLLVCYIDFGSNKAATAADFLVTITSALRKQG